MEYSWIKIFMEWDEKEDQMSWNLWLWFEIFQDRINKSKAGLTWFDFTAKMAWTSDDENIGSDVFHKFWVKRVKTRKKLRENQAAITIKIYYGCSLWIWFICETFGEWCNKHYFANVREQRKSRDSRHQNRESLLKNKIHNINLNVTLDIMRQNFWRKSFRRYFHLSLQQRLILIKYFYYIFLSQDIHAYLISNKIFWNITTRQEAIFHPILVYKSICSAS